MGGLVGVGGGTVWGSHCSRGTLRQFGVNSYLPISMEVNQYDKAGIAMPVHAQPLVSGMTPLVCSPRFSISASAYLGSFWQGCFAMLLESQQHLPKLRVRTDDDGTFSRNLSMCLNRAHHTAACTPALLRDKRYSSEGSLGDGKDHLDIEGRLAFNRY